MSTAAQQDWERDCVAYLRHLASLCKDCLRTDRCGDCSIRPSKSLLARKASLGFRHVRVVDRPKDAHSLKARYREILDALRAEDRPLRAREIVLRSTNSRNVKWWTLRRMVQKRLVCTTRVKNFCGRMETAYFIPNRKRKDNA